MRPSVGRWTAHLQRPRRRRRVHGGQVDVPLPAHLVSRLATSLLAHGDARGSIAPGVEVTARDSSAFQREQSRRVMKRLGKGLPLPDDEPSMFWILAVGVVLTDALLAAIEWWL